MESTELQWRKAFALQALSDLDAREHLAKTSLPLCHQLHFLQMACEKVCKAHQIDDEGTFEEKHDVIAKTLPVLARQVFSSQDDFNPKRGQRAAIQKMAQEIELLSPSCNSAKSRPDNSEYPWLNGKGEVQTPCLFSFSAIFDNRRTMIQLIQVVRRAARMYSA